MRTYEDIQRADLEEQAKQKCKDKNKAQVVQVQVEDPLFLKQTPGLICCFTIKNPTWPE